MSDIVKNEQKEDLPMTVAEAVELERHKQKLVLSATSMLGFFFAVLSAIACLLPALPPILNELTNQDLLFWESIVLIAAVLALILSIIGVVSCRRPYRVGRGFGINGIVFSSVTILVCVGLVVWGEYLINLSSTAA